MPVIRTLVLLVLVQLDKDKIHQASLNQWIVKPLNFILTGHVIEKLKLNCVLNLIIMHVKDITIK